MARREPRSDYEKLSKPELIEKLVDLEKCRSETRLKASRPVPSDEESEDALPSYAELFEHAPLAYCVIDRQLNVVEANAAAAALLGVRRTMLIGAPLACESGDALARHLARCFDGERRVTSELRFVVEGRDVVVDAVSAPVLQGDSVVSCITMLDDVTATKRAELRAQLLAAAGEALALPLDERPALGRIAQLFVPAFADACFVDLCEARGKVRRVEVEPHGRGDLAERLRRQASDARWIARRSKVLSSRKPVFELESPLTRELGAAGWILVPLVVRRRAHGLFGFVTVERQYTEADFGTAKDLARRTAIAIENARLYETMRQRVRARDDRLATVAHDLSQPVSIILGYASAARSQAADTLAQTMRTIRRVAERMNRMLRDLLDLSSIDAGRLPLARKPVDMSALVRDVVETFTPIAQAKNIALRVTSADAPLLAYADADRIAQVLGNFLDNAIKFTPEGGDIHVTAQARPGGTRVSVRDTGPGIPNELVEHIFERYTQAPETATAGHGLGLAIAKGIIVASHGAIGVESKVGEGSTFFFTLPGH